LPRKKEDVEAHDAVQSHRYLMHFPPHPAREHDPHYKDFDHFHRQYRDTARCHIGERVGFDTCRDAQGNPALPVDGGAQPGLELHHAHIEFSLQNGISLSALAKDYPGVDDPNEVGKWVESGTNFRWLCAWHHRGAAGAHTASHADWEASQYVLGLLDSPPPRK
jgi:hypothetical protein